MKIRDLIRLGFICFTIMTLIVGGIALLNLNRINSAMNIFSQYKVPSAKATERVSTFMRQAHHHATSYLLTHEKKDIENMTSCIRKIKGEINRIKKLTKGGEPELAKLNSYLIEFDDTFKRIVKMHKNGEGITKKLRFAGREVENIVKKEYPPSTLITILQARRQEKNFMALGNKKLAEGERTYEDKFEEAIKDLSRFGSGDANFKEKIKIYQNLFRQFVTNYRETDILVNELINEGNQIQNLATNISRKSSRESDDAISKIENLIKSARVWHILIILLVIVAVSFGLLLSSYIANLFYRPMENLARAMKKAQHGKLSARADTFREDEVGALAKGFNSMMDEIERSNNKIKTLQTQLIQSERLASLGEISAGIAHEINNPLAGILIYSNLLLEDTKDAAPEKENLKRIMEQANRCKDIVKGLLDFSRQTEPKIELISINKYIEGALKLVENQALFHNIEIRRELAQNLPFIKGDAAQLQQVFLNILINAGEAMPQGGKIDVETNLSKDGNFIEIKFKDTGCGIPKKNLKKVFDPFFTTKPPGKGTGLGLSVSYGIVKNHNGVIDIESQEGKGTTFTIKLPSEKGSDT